MHGFNSTGNREEDERLITFKKLNWEAHVWRTAVESQRYGDIRVHMKGTLIHKFCEQAAKMEDPEGKLIEWHEKNNERKRILEAEVKAAMEKEVALKKDEKRVKKNAQQSSDFYTGPQAKMI